MKKLTIFTDPHLGTARQAHTTKESSARLKQDLYHQALSIVHTADNPVFCAGDLFDKAFNPESVIVQGYNVASRCWMTLSGNHDETNREGTVTSLRAIKDMGAPICAVPDLSTPYFDSFESIYMVPHHASQELFIEACLLAANHAAYNREGQASYLFLHCSYAFDLAIEDSTLNLPEDIARDLLQAFDFIFIGHEHNRSRHLDGRVVVLGNIHPTSFHDVGDKFVYHLDLETAELTEEQVWSKAERYREIKLGSELPDLSGVQFIDVTGAESVASAGEVNDFIRSIWKASCYRPEGEEGFECDLLAVRNRVALRDSLQDVDTEAPPVALEDLQTRIKQDLKGTDLEPLFNELMSEVTA